MFVRLTVTTQDIYIYLLANFQTNLENRSWWAGITINVVKDSTIQEQMIIHKVSRDFTFTGTVYSHISIATCHGSLEQEEKNAM